MLNECIFFFFNRGREKEKKGGGGGVSRGGGILLPCNLTLFLKLFAIKVIQQIFEWNPTNKEG